MMEATISTKYNLYDWIICEVGDDVKQQFKGKISGIHIIYEAIKGSPNKDYTTKIEYAIVVKMHGIWETFYIYEDTIIAKTEVR